MRFATLSLALALALVAACASEEPECRIHPSGEPGVRLLECPSGTARIIGGDAEGACTLTSEKEGWRRVSCSDGTSVLIDPEGKVHYPGSGSIQGLATLLGSEGDDEGIVVRARGTPFEARTDADGQFALLDLPAGLYELVFEYPGRIPEVRENIPVVNGTYTLEGVEISASLHLSTHHGAETIPSPSADSLLVVETTQYATRLTLVHLETWEVVHLSSNAHAPVYRFDGREVLWTENLSSRSRVWTYDVDSGERGELPVRGRGATYLGDGRTILVETESGNVRRLLAHDTVEGETVEIGTWSPSPLDELPTSPDGGAVVFRAGTEIVLWDHENRERVVLADSSSGLQDVYLHPSGRHVAIVRREGAIERLFSADLSRGSGAILEPALLGPPIPHPSDGSLLWEGEEGWKLWDGATGEVVDLPLPVTEGSTPKASFLPDGSGVLHVDFPLVHLMRRDEEAPRLLSAQAIRVPSVTSDARHVIIPVIEDDLPHTRVVRVGDGSSVRLEGEDWALAPGSDWLYRLAEQALSSYDLETGETQEIFDSVVHAMPGGSDTLLFRPAGDLSEHKIGLWERSSAKLRWFDGNASDARLSPDGRYLFFRGCGPGEEAPCASLYRIDLESEVYERVGVNVHAYADVYDRVMTYWVFEEPAGLHLVKTTP